jgi:isopentenyl diphosphate isomerase/L-lactate dehydrogenase-like FMN-dependent dehydrogenase
LKQLAKKRVPKMFFEYADSGSYTQSTYRANEDDFQKIKLRQRVAINMESRSTSTTMIGQPASMPVAIAPTGMTGMQHADGEILAARAAKKFGIPFTLSTMSICSIEDVAQHVGPGFWFQLYVMRDRSFIERLIDRAKAAQCSALVLTLDLQILGQRHRDLKNGLSAPPKPTIANLINLIGPVRRVGALTSSATPTRTILTEGPRKGEEIPVKTPTNIHALLEFANGATVNLSTSWDVWANKRVNMELYGTEGSIFVPDPNFFGGTFGFG